MAELAATISGILSLADITLRLGLKTYETIADIKKARREILDLAKELDGVNDILGNCAAYLDKCRNDPPPEESRKAFRSIEQAINDCHEQYFELVKIAERHAKASNGGTPEKMLGKLKWLLLRKETSGHVQKLVRLRGAFHTSLSLAGWSVKWFSLLSECY